MRKKKKSPGYDLKLAINSADNFRAISQAFTKTLHGVGLNDFHEQQYQLGTIVSSATNLSLSLEIFLKAVYMICRMPVPAEHHLWSLFSGLPEVAQVSIKRSYDAANKSDGAELAALRIYSSKTAAQPKSAPKPGPIDLKSVLVRSGNAFVTWRYFYERDEDQEWQLFEYEFLRLDLACAAVREYCVAQLGASVGA